MPSARWKILAVDAWLYEHIRERSAARGSSMNGYLRELMGLEPLVRPPTPKGAIANLDVGDSVVIPLSRVDRIVKLNDSLRYYRKRYGFKLHKEFVEGGIMVTRTG
jgi:hypothetical protein